MDLPWVMAGGADSDGLVVQRGRPDTLAYDDGIVMEVAVIDPSRFESAGELVKAAAQEAAPGRLLLAAGVVPVGWRGELREAPLSFIDVSGVAEIDWPRLRVSTRRFGKNVRRRRAPLGFQKGNGLAAQELLIAAFDDTSVSIEGLAERAGVSAATASRTVAQLAEHGLVTKERDGHRVWVTVLDRTALARRLADSSRWPGDETLTGYLWGRSVFHVAARLSAEAERIDVALAVTGRVGAAYLGVIGTSSPSDVRAWVDAGGRPLEDIAGHLGLEPAAGDDANIVLSTDRWRLGTHRRSEVMFDDWSAQIAHPLRVWCDLHSESRGTEFAAQLWGAIAGGR